VERDGPDVFDDVMPGTTILVGMKDNTTVPFENHAEDSKHSCTMFGSNVKVDDSST
jgi:hypothetical protein